MNGSANHKPLISFCLSTFMRGQVLKNTLETIKFQDYTNFEVIISDNDPNGSGREFVEKLGDSRFKYFNNGANLGMKPSFNKSLERSSGDFIVMMADDDPIYPGMLQTLVELQVQYPGYGMYMGGCDWFCADKEVAKLYKLHVGTNSCLSDDHDLNFIQVYSTPEFLKNLFTFSIFSHFLWSTCMVKRSLLIEMGGVPDYGTPFLGDYAYMSISSTGNGCVIINRSLGCQTLHKENFGRNQNDQLPVLVKNFPAYLDGKLSHLQEWPEIRKIVMHFFGVWVTGHMAFLHHYNKNKNKHDPSLKKVETQVLNDETVKKYKLKYFLKKRMPYVHDLAIKIKKFI